MWLPGEYYNPRMIDFARKIPYARPVNPYQFLSRGNKIKPAV